MTIARQWAKDRKLPLWEAMSLLARKRPQLYERMRDLDRRTADLAWQNRQLQCEAGHMRNILKKKESKQ